MKKQIFSKFLCFFSAFCLFSWFIMFFSPAPVLSYATDGEPDTSITLTVAQTLALYGTQIPCLLYNSRGGTQLSVTFDYAFQLSSVGYMDEGGGFDYSDVYGSIQESVGRSQIASYISDMEALVYIASSSQWGGTNISPYVQSNLSPLPPQIHFPFSISLSQIGGMEQAILYPTYHNTFNTQNVNYNTCTLTVITDPNQTFHAIKGDTYGGVDTPADFALPTYPYYDSYYDPDTGMTSHIPLDQTRLQYFSGFYFDMYDEYSSYDIRGMTLDAFGITSTQTNSNDLWLIVSCPTLYGYTPPVVTTTETIPTATFPTATFPTSTTYDPLKIINDNSNTIISQLNTIIGQLNAIYNRMVAQGQIPVDLVPADQLHTLPTGVETQLHQAIQGFTTSRLPDAGNGYTFYGNLYSFFTTDSLSFFGVFGGFSLALTVVCWFIFRGRH